MGAEGGLTTPRAGAGLEAVLIAVKRRLGPDERALGFFFYGTWDFGCFQQQQDPADPGGDAPGHIPAGSRDTTPPHTPPGG